MTREYRANSLPTTTETRSDLTDAIACNVLNDDLALNGRTKPSIPSKAKPLDVHSLMTECRDRRERLPATGNPNSSSYRNPIIYAKL